ncbi:MAG: hypothetical protein J6Y79_00375 [Paludibacteraceae bacterium]|nr:hypothetical protein [Paludibacteraceae bacterium]
MTQDFYENAKRTLRERYGNDVQWLLTEELLDKKKISRTTLFNMLRHCDRDQLVVKVGRVNFYRLDHWDSCVKEYFKI